MKNYFLFIALLGGIQPLMAAPDPESLLVLASRALEEGLPQVAEQKTRAILSGTLTPGQRNKVALKLAEALIEQSRGEEALRTIDSLGSSVTADSGLLRARALVAEGKWSEALPLFEAGDAGSLPVACGRAHCLEALGRGAEAISVYEAIKDPSPLIRFKLIELAIATGDLKRAQAALAAYSDTQDAIERRGRNYLESRLLLAQGKAEQSTDGFEDLLKNPQGFSEEIYAAATLGLTEARIRTGGLENADNVLEEFIWKHPTSAYLEPMFRRLDQVYALEENASDSELEKWVEKAPVRRSALALYYYACMQTRAGQSEHALKKFQLFSTTYPNHSLAAHALYKAGKLLAADSKLDAALSCFDASIGRIKDKEFLAEVEMTSGICAFQKGDFVLASNRFKSAASHSERFWQQAIFNSALAWMQKGDFEKFLDDYKELSRRFPESQFRPELLVEEGLLQARSGDSKAKATLLLFLKDFPSHQRVGEAQLALAELAFIGSDQNSTSPYLNAALQSSSAQTADRATLLAIFQADTPNGSGQRDDARVTELCLQFLKDQPGSELTDQVRMKLGQVYFRLEDYANAQTQFETLAEENPGSPLAESALFLAGQSSMRSMNTGGVDRAIGIFQQVAEANGALQLYARQQQAIAYTRLGKESEAIILYDEILSASPPADLRFAVLGAKGDCLVTTAGKDEKLISQAMAVFAQLAEQPDVTAFWRNQALYKKAKCLESLARPSEALAIYYDILQAASVPGGEGPDYTWFYKAGFDAAGALETQDQWIPAIGIYEKLANLLGPRSEEAKKRVDQLRLEHFIWEE